MRPPGRGEIHFSGKPLAAEAKKLIRKAVAETLRTHNVKSARIGIRIMSDGEIALMNKEHLAHQGPTDVITFNLGGDDSSSVEGELAISLDTAIREASQRGHPSEAELALYAVHGVLHLVGYSDKGASAARLMHETEDRILKSVGMGAVFDREIAELEPDPTSNGDLYGRGMPRSLRLKGSKAAGRGRLRTSTRTRKSA